MADPLTTGGVPGLREIPWGTHCCHFYDGRHDLVETLVPFFKAGLDNHEACVWVTSEPLRAADARSALSAAVPGLARLEQRGQIEIIDHEEWYLRSGGIDAETTLKGWVEREAAAMERGYSGFRLTGNTSWLQRDDWESFVEYESLVSETFRGHRIVGLCSYCLASCTPRDIMDVVRNHEFTIARRENEWEIIESKALNHAREGLARYRGTLHEERKAAQGLRAREEEYRTLIETIPQIVWTATADGTPEYHNRRWYEATGLTPQQCREGAWERAMHPEDLDRFRAAWERALLGGKAYEVECRQRHVDSSDYRWYLIRAEPLRGADGRIERWVGTCTDIEMQKRAEASLREADRRKDEFLAMLGHELRSPLSAILTTSQLMTLRGAGERFAKEQAVIERQVRHLAGLVDDLLDVARIARGKLELRRSPVELAEVVARGIETAGTLLEQRAHVLELNVPSRGLLIHGDVRRLAQVVSNLLTNAAKYTEPGGTITVTGERRQSSIILSVEDTGVGIPRHLLSGIFELFVQGERSREPSVGGLGLGLPIVRNLVQLHGGNIEVRSEHGRGSEFLVSLPVGG